MFVINGLSLSYPEFFFAGEKALRQNQNLHEIIVCALNEIVPSYRNMRCIQSDGGCRDAIDFARKQLECLVNPQLKQARYLFAPIIILLKRTVAFVEKDVTDLAIDEVVNSTDADAAPKGNQIFKGDAQTELFFEFSQAITDGLADRQVARRADINLVRIIEIIPPLLQKQIRIAVRLAPDHPAMEYLMPVAIAMHKIAPFDADVIQRFIIDVE